MEKSLRRPTGSGLFKIVTTPLSSSAVILLACALFTGIRYAMNHNWMAFVDYDGYYSYYIARWGFDASQVAPLIDMLGPGYRYQRIIYPILAYFLSLGNPSLAPFFLVLLNIGSITAGTYLVALILRDMGISPWYSLVFGLYGGQFLGLMTCLSEPMAFFFISLGIYLWTRDEISWATVAFAMATLTKEIALPFIFALAVYQLLLRRCGAAAKIASATLPYALWQTVLWFWLGAPGISTGEPFEFPLWGWVSGFVERPSAALLLAIVLIPMSYLPMILLGVKALLDVIRKRILHPYSLMILAHVAFMLVLPKLTAREPAAMLRITQGLMLSALLYGGLVKSRRILNYSVLWTATLAILVNGSR